MTPAASVAFAPAFRRPSVRDATLLLATASALPLLVHLLPSWDRGPLGAHLLPMFWATFVAAYFYGAATGAITGLVSPLVNLLFTTLPAWSMIALLGCELVVFALVSAWLVKRAPGSRVSAPLAFLVAVVVCAGLQAVAAPFGQTGATRLLVASLTTGLPGIALLTVFNFFLVKTYPKR